MGCVIVDKDGQVIGRGRNRREEEKNPLAHAELDAIADACRRYGDWAAEGGPALRHPGALPHVRRGDHLRPDPGDLLWGQRRGLWGLRLHPEPL